MWKCVVQQLWERGCKVWEVLRPCISADVFTRPLVDLVYIRSTWWKSFSFRVSRPPFYCLLVSSTAAKEARALLIPDSLSETKGLLPLWVTSVCTGDVQWGLFVPHTGSLLGQHFYLGKLSMITLINSFPPSFSSFTPLCWMLDLYVLFFVFPFFALSLLIFYLLNYLSY